MAAGAVLGGVDRICGNRLGLGKRFEEGFMLLGATALSMAGIICLAPLLFGFLEHMIAPLWNGIGLDPAPLGGILAIDMGGYQLAQGLAQKEEMANYAGIVIGATFGCTVTFTIPVGMGMIEKKERPLFAKGMLIGLGVMPAALLLGGLFCGLRIGCGGRSPRHGSRPRRPPGGTALRKGCLRAAGPSPRCGRCRPRCV